MKRSQGRALLCLGLLIAMHGPTSAGSVPLEHDPNFPIDLGKVPKFRSESEAIAGCGGDAVVWADRRTGFFYPKFSEHYGKSEFGAFTCHKQALDADYWGFGIISNYGGKGREFPDSFPCTKCT